MDLFSDSLIGICDAWSIAMHADFVSNSVSEADKEAHAIQVCSRQIWKYVPRAKCVGYDAILTVEAQNKDNGQSRIIGALFLKKTDCETYTVLNVTLNVPQGDTRCIDMLLLLMASEVAAAHEGKQLVHYLQEAPDNYAQFTKNFYKMGFFWLDANGNATHSTDVLSKDKKNSGMRPCYKLCRPKFTISNAAVYFTKCLMNDKAKITDILRKGRLAECAHFDWDIVISYGDSCKIFMRKMKDENVYEVYHRGVDLENKQGVIREAAVYDCKSEDVKLNFFHDGI
jgi:hypothetical protein